MNKNKGFTLMELMMVIAIIMILAGAIVARVSTTGERARVAKAKGEVEEIASACRAFNMDTGLWPTELISLIVEPVDAYDEDHGPKPLSTGSWGGPYLEVETAEVPNDPWDEPYALSHEGNKLYATSGPAHAAGIKRLVHLFNP